MTVTRAPQRPSRRHAEAGMRARTRAGGRGRALALPFVCSLLCGCYYAELAGGQLAMINQQQPLHTAIAAERDPERKRLLERVPDIRAFARDAMQLRPGRNYTSYYETEQSGIAFVLSACERTSFTPYTFSFPIVGEVAYKSFFDEREAREAADALDRDGYDVYLGHVTAYSTLGYLRDPVTTVMMRKGELGFIEVLLHEMTHGRLYVPGQTDFDEQLASFTAERGLEQYVRTRFGADSPRAQELAERLARRRAFEGHVQKALDALTKLYAAGLPERVVLARREPVFARLRAELAAVLPEAGPDELVINNARLLQYQRYLSGAPRMRGLWQQAGGSFVRFWPLVERYARTLD